MQKELENLRSLHEQLNLQHEKVLRSWSEYRLEAEKQIEGLKAERDRARRWQRAFWIGGAVALVSGFVAAVMLCGL